MTQFAQIGLAAISAGGQLYAASAQRNAYNAQAEQAKIQGRSEAIKYQQQGAYVLRNLNQTLAATLAVAGAGNVDPTSGSARVLQDFARAEAYAEFGTAQDNAILAKEGAAAQAPYATGIVNAIGTMGQGIQRSLTLQPGATAV